MADQFDIAILGGGPGGYVAALYAGLKGAKVALIERERVGGTCVTVGCIPSKALLDSSHGFWLATHGQEHGIGADGARFDLSKSVARKETVVTTLVTGIEQLLKTRKVELIKAEGTLVGPNEIRAGERSVRAKNVIVATGSKVGVPPIKGLAEAKPLDNVGALALQSVPKRLIVVGAGVVGMELGTFYAEVGSQVTVLEMLPQALAFADPELVRVLVRSLEPRGLTVRTDAKVTEVKRGPKGVTVVAEIAGKQEAFEGDEVLLGAGRVANLSGVEKAGFETNKLGITVDDRMRTNVAGVFAIGDCIGDPRSPKLAHVASTQGEVAVDAILGDKDAVMDYDVVPNVVYTHPELATVGLSEAQAKEKHGEAKVARFPFRASGRALALGEFEGLVKLVLAGDRIVGAHIVGPQASELIATASLAVRLEATTYDLIHTITAHPTLSEAIREAALSAAGTPIHTAR